MSDATDKLDSLIKDLFRELYSKMKNVPQKDAISVRVSFAFFLGTRLEEFIDKEDRQVLAAALDYLSRADDQQIMDIVKGAEASATGNS